MCSLAHVASTALNHINTICSTWGRDHFKTFDGDMYQFPGMCVYNLVSDCHETYQEFAVHIQRSKVDGNPKVHEVVVTINDLLFHLTRNVVSLNSDVINLPYYNAGIQIERNAVYTKLQAKVGLVVMWNGDDAVMGPVCNEMIHSEAWSSCKSLVNPTPYTQACVQDMCGCSNSTDDFCVCSTLAEYSRQCSHAGGQPPSWRTPEFCVEEGSHVTTFDGKAYMFHGDCHYTLAKVESKDDASPKFTILVHLVPCVSHEFDTCLRSVKVLLNNDRNNMNFVQILAFSADGKVSHNMQIISLPYHTGDINIFQASSFHILLQTRFGLQIQVQHVPVLQVYLTLEQSYKTKTRGLCGNYNMKLFDDMTTPQGMVEGTASSFGNSWKSNPTCQDRKEQRDNPCSLSLENERYAEHWCSLLTSPNSTFTKCHSMIDPEMYHKRCIYATCNCEKTEACMCAVFSSYARACAVKGVFLSDWRVNVCDKYTTGCPKSQSFSYKLQRCKWTCKELNLEQHGCTSDFLPVDGCSCPEGMYLDDKGACVPMAKCPCYHNGVHIKPGKSMSIKEQHCDKDKCTLYYTPTNNTITNNTIHNPNYRKYINYNHANSNTHNYYSVATNCTTQYNCRNTNSSCPDNNYYTSNNNDKE
ncbi:unnamed protein product [Merluccius merluccius]